MRDSIFPSVSHAHSADTQGDNFWDLVPDELPHMEYSATSAGNIVRTDLGQLNKAGPPLGTINSIPTSVPPNSDIHLLLDRKTLTTAYPQLTVSGGKGSKIVVTYAEALYDKSLNKGDRDEVASIASSSLSGGAPGAISTSTSPRATNPSRSNP